MPRVRRIANSNNYYGKRAAKVEQVAECLVSRVVKNKGGQPITYYNC